MMDWKAVAKDKRDSVNALIPQSWLIQTPVPPASEQKDVTGKYIQQFLSPREIEIIEADAVEIVNNTISGVWKAREVTEAFCHRAALAHQMVNCLHGIFFEAAILDAQKLDDYYSQHQKPIGPLHGLPISLKDQFHVKGVETSMGYVGWIGTFEGKRGTEKEKVFESEMVKELRALGAVLYHQIPELIRWAVGGSIRVPCAFNGLFGIRPSSGRLPYEGMANSMDGQNSILSVVGPLATSVGSLKLVIRAILGQHPWLHDPLVVELPWRDEQERFILDIANSRGGKQLAFGLMIDDGTVQPHPPVRRALDIVVKTIQRLGHRIIEWKPPFHEKGLPINYKTSGFDGGTDVHNAFALSGEPMASQIAGSYGTKAPEYLASQIAAVNVQKRQFQKEYMEYWNSTSALTGTDRPIDSIICACAPFAAARPDMYKYYGFSTWVNLVDYSASILPVTLADKHLDLVEKDFKPLSEADREAYDSYDPEIYDGAHVAVQIVGRRFQEEKVLAITKILDDALGSRVT